MKFWFRNVRDLLACLWRLRPHLRGGRYLVAAVAGAALCGALMEGVGVSLLVPLLSLLLGGEGATPMRPIAWLRGGLPGHSASFYVVVFCLLVFATIALKNAIIYASQVLAGRLRQRIGANLRLSLFQRLHGSGLHVFEQHSAGVIASVFFNETARTISLVDYLLLIGQRASIGLFYFAMLLYISWPLTLITLVLAATIGAFIFFAYRRLAHSGQATVALSQRMMTLVNQSFAGIRVVRATNSQAAEIRRFQELNLEQGRVEERSTRTALLVTPITETVAVAGAMVIIGCAYHFFVKTGVMLSSYLLGFGFILLRLLPLINQLYGLQGHVVFLAEGVRQVEQWLETPQYPARPFGELEFTRVERHIRFAAVQFVYPNGTQALRGVSFTVPAGKKVALVGGSGSGKSTLAALLLRFRQPTSGRIEVDDRDYWEFSAESWHKAVGVVEQEAFLFHDTMANNIAYGCADASPEAVLAAVRIAHLEDVIQSLPEGLNSVVGERGTMLSGGQRQRLAIARALVRNPRILILDEATSALDTISERQVQTALESAMTDRTVLVIAHRLSTVRNADHIVVLDQGAVAEQGSWEELSGRAGAFARLLRLSSTQAE